MPGSSGSASDDDDSFEQQVTDPQESESPQYSGTLSKWTNYIHGWQDRYVSCKEGTLCYYRSEDETEYGCRGSVLLSKAIIYCNEFDECRFDVAINDSVWYLRATGEPERRKWIDAIEANKSETASAANSNSALRRQGSLLSLGSAPSIASTSSFRQTRNLQQKLAEMETFRDILYRQIDTLQAYFDSCADKAEQNGVAGTYLSLDSEEDDELQNHKPSKQGDGGIGRHNGIDFRGEAITFKATTAGVLNTLAYCVELMNKREEVWQRKMEREQEKRKRLELQFTDKLAATRKTLAYMGSPDFEEGPMSELTEEQFFECVEAELDKQDRFEHDLEQSKNLLREAEFQPKRAHEHSDRLEKRVKQHLEESLELPADGEDGEEEGGWELFADEGEMKVYRRELIVDDRICDPLKAIHSIGSVTAREMCHYFWDTSVRLEWEGTIESFRVVEALDDCTTIIYQTHKRVWPSAQRDCLYLSHMLQIKDQPKAAMGRGEPHDTWMVCNFSVEHAEAKPLSGCVRAVIDIALICQTFVKRTDESSPVTRDNLQCDIVYVANVNPGGWAPASVLRAIYKREYPKFLRKFTAYVQEKTNDKEILF